ncbi:MAG: SUMF1/EgtB/PvdO family nonheme iron enzyme [Thermodesulfovibrionales bacterium]
MLRRKSEVKWQMLLAVTVVVAIAEVMGGLVKADASPESEMIFVKGGCFEMGDTFGNGLKNEKPVHEVCVQDFYIGKYEVTQGQWQAVMGNNPSAFKGCGYSCPVESVSWDDVQEFIRRLKAMTGKKYRLPTEAEWEYAARSGGKNQQWAGTSRLDDLEDYAWYSDDSGKRTHPVGRKKPNGLGIYDMSGNVWEWVRDYYDEKYYEKSPKENPPGPLSGRWKVLRGGAWYLGPSFVRSSFRFWGLPSFRNGFFGVRLALPSP